MTLSQCRLSTSSLTCRMRATKEASCAIWSARENEKHSLFP